jgi:hypothetical protein
MAPSHSVGDCMLTPLSVGAGPDSTALSFSKQLGFLLTVLRKAMSDSDLHVGKGREVSLRSSCQVPAASHLI